MKEFIRRGAEVLLDLRLIVGICGILLSIAAHELFHIIVHWGEINSIHIFPDSQAIVEVVFTPTAEYDLVAEEAIAYTITMVTLLLTAMLIGDIHDAYDEKTVEQTFLDNTCTDTERQRSLNHLARLLG